MLRLIRKSQQSRQDDLLPTSKCSELANFLLEKMESHKEGFFYSFCGTKAFTLDRFERKQLWEGKVLHTYSHGGNPVSG